VVSDTVKRSNTRIRHHLNLWSLRWSAELWLTVYLHVFGVFHSLAVEDCLHRRWMSVESYHSFDTFLSELVQPCSIGYVMLSLKMGLKGAPESFGVQKFKYRSQYRRAGT